MTDFINYVHRLAEGVPHARLPDPCTKLGKAVVWSMSQGAPLVYSEIHGWTQKDHEAIADRPHITEPYRPEDEPQKWRPF